MSETSQRRRRGSMLAGPFRSKRKSRLLSRFNRRSSEAVVSPYDYDYEGHGLVFPPLEGTPDDAGQGRRLHQIESTQHRMLAELSELNAAVRVDHGHRGRDSTRSLLSMGLGIDDHHRGPAVATPISPPRSLRVDGTDARRESDAYYSVPDADEPDSGEVLDRKQVRLDGLEVYAVVSAVTAGTLVAVFDSYHPGDVVELFLSGRYLEVLMGVIFLVTGSIGIICGLHCIFVFSLITMYGRTALGMERDDALEVFFCGTGKQRYNGFRTFVGSLYALMCELIVVIASKISSNAWVHLAALLVTSSLMYYVYVDTQQVMEKAGVIFAPPPEPVPSREGEEVGEVGRGGSISRRGSARSLKSVQWSTRRTLMNVPACALIKDCGNSGRSALSMDSVGEEDDGDGLASCGGEWGGRRTYANGDPLLERKSSSFRRLLSKRKSTMNMSANEIEDRWG